MFIPVHIHKTIPFPEALTGTEQVHKRPGGISEQIHAVPDGLGTCLNMLSEIVYPVVVVDLAVFREHVPGPKTIFRDNEGEPVSAVVQIEHRPKPHRVNLRAVCAGFQIFILNMPEISILVKIHLVDWK